MLQKTAGPAAGDGGPERRVLMRNLSQSEYRNDRVVVNTLHAAARALKLTPRALLALPRGELRRLVRRARAAAEKEWDAISRRIDALVAAEDLIQEGRL